MQIELYHGASSVCSSKVRVFLAEKRLNWKSHLINLKAGEQNDPEYLKLNPNGVVPTLVNGEMVVRESSVILEYLDDLAPDHRLMPAEEPSRTRARMWLARCIEVHAAINTMTFSTVQRARILAVKTPEQIEANIARMANPATASKRREVLRHGLDSEHVAAAFFTLRVLFNDMQAALQTDDWLLGKTYSIADTGLLSYVDRLGRLGFSGLWTERTPRVGDWLATSKLRASYAALADFTDQAAADEMKQEGTVFWPQLQKRWEAYLGQTDIGQG